MEKLKLYALDTDDKSYMAFVFSVFNKYLIFRVMDGIVKTDLKLVDNYSFLSRVFDFEELRFPVADDYDIYNKYLNEMQNIFEEHYFDLKESI